MQTRSLRRRLLRLAYDFNLSPREMKAWSQNLGHESMMTSLTSYGALRNKRPGDHVDAKKRQFREITSDSMRLIRAVKDVWGGGITYFQR